MHSWSSFTVTVILTKCRVRRSHCPQSPPTRLKRDGTCQKRAGGLVKMRHCEASFEEFVKESRHFFVQLPESIAPHTSFGVTLGPEPIILPLMDMNRDRLTLLKMQNDDV